MKTLALTLLALLPAVPAAAQVQRDDLTPLEIAYTTTVAEDLQSFQVEMDVRNVARPHLHVAMPEWMPGAYMLFRFGKRVQDLAATRADGTPLEIVRLNEGAWSITTAGSRHVRVRYRVPASRGWRGRRPDPDEPVTGLRINGPGTYMYVEGAKSLPVTVTYRLPEGWKIANGLLPGADPTERQAKDYDTFIDAPTIVGHFLEREFAVAGTPFRCVFFQNNQEYDFDIDAFVALVQQVVESQGRLFGSFPFPNYVFLFTLPGGGGLEHLNSTSIGLDPAGQKKDPRHGISVVSHEFFHAWNVKRIRPKVLGPFAYQRESYTGNLWVSEGWTSYFGDLTLARTGIWGREEYLAQLARAISAEMSKVRRKEHSVDWASRNVWHDYPGEEEPRVDYYATGEYLGALMDLKIRHETAGRKSLNDVMRFLNRWFAERGVGFEEGDIERACTAISNHDLGEFFARHVTGTVDPPFAEIFAYAGIEYAEERIPCSFPFRLRGRRIAGRRHGGEAEAAGDAPRPGETIVEVDGQPFEDANAVLRRHQPGDKVRLVLERDGDRREVEVELTDKARVIVELRFMENPTEEQLRIREAWLSSVQ